MKVSFPLIKSRALSKSWSEIEKATVALSELKKATNLQEAEASWLEFVCAIDRVRKKTLLGMVKNSSSNTLKTNYHNLRKRDELISYLKASRDAFEHSTRENVAISFADSSMGKLGIVDISGNVTPLWAVPAFRDFLKKSGFENDTLVKLEDAKKKDFDPTKMKLCTVINRGKPYAPPTSHLGKPIKNKGPVSIATLALKFYTDFVVDAERCGQE